MKQNANARFAIKNWDEKPYSEGADLPKLTRASVTKMFTGDIEGEGHVEYLMMYRSDGSATFVGLERIDGRIGDKTGSFVLATDRRIRGRFGEGDVLRCPRLGDRRSSRPRRRGQLVGWTWDGASVRVELRIGIAVTRIRALRRDRSPLCISSPL